MKIGYHVNREETLLADLTREASRIRAIFKGRGISVIPTLQIFAAGPKGSRPIKVTNEELREIHKAVANEEFIVVIHGSYLDRPFDTSLRPDHHPIAVETAMARKMGAIGPIIHMSKLSRRNGDGHIPHHLPLVFEGDATRDVPTIEALLDEVNSLHFPIVIDTAHVYASGIDIHDEKVMGRLLEGLPIGDNKKHSGRRSFVIGIHLNDTPSICGSGIDRHATIGEGNIFHGHSGRKALRKILDWAIINDVFIIIETPREEDGGHEKELGLILDAMSEE